MVERRGERQVAAGEALAEAEEVGRDPLLLAGEHRPGAPEAGRDLVADQEHVVAVAKLAHPAQVPGRLDPDPGGALHERLDDHRRDLLGVEVEHALELVGVAGLDVVSLEQEGGVGGVEEVDPADRDGAQRVAVVGVAQARRRRCAGRAGRRAAASTGTPS